MKTLRYLLMTVVLVALSVTLKGQVQLLCSGGFWGCPISAPVTFTANHAYNFGTNALGAANIYGQNLGDSTAPFTEAEIQNLNTVGHYALTSGSSITFSPSATYGIVGTVAADTAGVGLVGEFFTATKATGSSVTVATGSATPITSITLTAGDWDVWGVVDYTAASTTSIAEFIQGTTSAANCLTAPVIPAQDFYTAVASATNIPNPAVDAALETPTNRYSVAGSTVVCLTTKPTFTASTLKAYGSIFARRRR